MKTLKIILISICITPAIATSQNTSNGEKKYRITSANLLMGGYFQKSYFTGLSDFRKLAPNSLLLSKNIDNYVPYENYASINTFLAPSICINKYNNENGALMKNLDFRIGVTYYSMSTFSSNLNYTERKRLDSIPNSGFHYDSVWYNHYSMNTNSEQLRLDASLLFRTNPDLRWSLFGGIGAELGGSLNSNVTVSFYEIKGVEFLPDGVIINPPNYTSYEKNEASEIIKIKNSFGAAVYLPMGFDWRMGSKREFFKQLHLFGEARPFLNLVNVRELNKNYIQAGIRAGLGLRVNF